jgi:hypothetical protein
MGWSATKTNVTIALALPTVIDTLKYVSKNVGNDCDHVRWTQHYVVTRGSQCIKGETWL